MRKEKIYIGTSGWNYGHWQEIFYPLSIKSRDWLSYYAKKFSTVEINSSFYHLPPETTFLHWQQRTPKNFLFAVKVWRKITHFKKIKDIEDDLKIFYQRALTLENKFGPLLFQFPPSFRATEENIKRLKNLSKFIRENLCLDPRRRPASQRGERGSPLAARQSAKHFVVEFRHQSWFSQAIYRVLKKYHLALCWADTPCYPYKEIVTADYIYFRLHGYEQLYASKYSQSQLKNYAQKIKKLIARKKTVYVYFDNDASGFAVENAQELKCLLYK